MEKYNDSAVAQQLTDAKAINKMMEINFPKSKVFMFFSYLVYIISSLDIKKT